MIVSMDRQQKHYLILIRFDDFDAGSRRDLWVLNWAKPSRAAFAQCSIAFDLTGRDSIAAGCAVAPELLRRSVHWLSERIPVMFMSVAAVMIAHQLIAGTSFGPSSDTAPLIQVQQQCGNGYDIDIYGRCYPNGVIPPQYQAARQGYGGYSGGGRYPVPCGDGADIDTRDGRCYPNGTVPYRYQQGRQGYYYDRPRRGYY
jgi:hypothetical protein